MENLTLLERNYWLDTLTRQAVGDSGPLPEKCDVAVIGAGFTGLAAARALAMSGARVVVLEGKSIGWGASSRNGGMVLSGLKLGPGTLVKRYGRERTQRMFAASLAAIDTVEQTVRDEGIACDFVRGGHLEVASKPAHFAHFEQAAELSAELFNHPLRLVGRGDLSQEIGSTIYHGGLVDDASAGVNPARYVHGLAEAAQRKGARIYEAAPVVQLSREAGGYKLHTGRGSVWAREVVVATSGYTGAVTAGLQRRIVPIGSYIVVTEPLPDVLARGVSPRDRMIFDSMNFLVYYRLTPDRRLLFGGRAGFDPENEATVRESAGILKRAMMHVYPQLRDVRIGYAWGGTLDFAFDMMPHAGRMDGLWYALGYAGHGVALATYLGTSLAGMVAGGAPKDNPFAEISFPGAPLGLYDGRPWFLPGAELWYKLLDRVT